MIYKPLAMAALITVFSGCTTLTTTEINRGERISSVYVGAPQVSDQQLVIKAQSLDNIHVSQSYRYTQQVEHIYAGDQINQYRTETLGWSYVIGFAMLGSFFALLDDSLCDQDASGDCDDKYAQYTAIGAIAGIIVGALDRNVRRYSRRMPADPIVEQAQYSGHRQQRVAHSPVTVSHDADGIVARLDTDAGGNLALDEAVLLDGGVHPLTLVYSSTLPLTFQAAGVYATVEVPLHPQDISEARMLVEQHIYNTLLASDFNTLIASDGTVAVKMIHEGRAGTVNIPINRLSEAFFRQHFARHRERLAQQFGARLNTCIALSASLHERYECLAREASSPAALESE